VSFDPSQLNCAVIFVSADMKGGLCITDLTELGLVSFDLSQVNCAGVFVSADMMGGS